MIAHSVDILFLAAAVILPIPLIIRWRFKGAILGAAIVWLLLAVSGIVLSELDPEREAGMLDSVWLLFGWIGGLLYCVPIWGLQELVRKAIGNRKDGSQQAHER